MTTKSRRAIEDFSIRKGRQEDIPLILRFNKELAEYEGIADRVTATEEDLLETLFGGGPPAETALAFIGEEPVGFAVFYHTFSTLLGKRGLHLDDLYIRPGWRGNGLGTKMLAWLASLAVERKCGRFEWWCLKDNTPALDFYQKIGAKTLDEVFILRLEGKDIADFAKE
ncbi:MAG: GNAT family N-acetyltransferase [Thermovirgaceae bacterium]|nr:GNAT family N-acetyltransferase [Thermovirgaceae bacterium]